MYENHPQFLRVLVDEHHAHLREQAHAAHLRRAVRKARRQRKG